MDDETPAIDEWTLSLSLGDRLAEVVEEHYRTFIVRLAPFLLLLFAF